jgi:hypothetical protein
MIARPLKERLFEKTRQEGACLVFTGYTTPTGYGRIGYGNTSIPTHRAAWLVTHGEMPDGYVLHHCDNPSCVNPDHLYIGDQFDNMRDMKERDRCSTGSKLMAAVIRIYAQTLTNRSLAHHMGVSPSTVSRIRNGHRW